MTAPAPSSALVILVPEAEAAVGRMRRKLDPSSSSGMPAHVSILYPFAPSDLLSDDVATRLTALFGAHQPFAFTLSELGWFDTRVLYVVPAPAGRFVTLTTAVAAAFPEYPPYRGAYPDIVPHMTVGEGARPARMRRAARRLGSGLPLEARAHEVCLMAPDGAGRWAVVRRFALGGLGP